MEVSHIGSLTTRTDFRLDDGSMIRLSVSFKNECYHSHQMTFYVTDVLKKGFKCKSWIYEFTTKHALDERILSIISEDQLYSAYYNHWQKMNPIRIFNSGQMNSELVGFRVKEKFETKHFAF